jgi:uncharacterized protein (TIGR02145 family)
MGNQNRKKYIWLILIAIVIGIILVLCLQKCGVAVSETAPVEEPNTVILSSDDTITQLPVKADSIKTDDTEAITPKETHKETPKETLTPPEQTSETSEKTSETEKPLQTEITKDNTQEKGVLINGILWATCNVAEPGTFAENPEDPGMLYQWNRKKAWPVKPREVSDWDNTRATGGVWEKVNDPCPKGWRVSTIEDIGKLCDKNLNTIEWVIENGVRCEKITDKANGNFILFPMPGSRHGNDGKLYRVGNGYYWSSDGNIDYKQGYYMLCSEHPNKAVAMEIPHNRNFAFCVRCVAESE